MLFKQSCSIAQYLFWQLVPHLEMWLSEAELSLLRDTFVEISLYKFLDMVTVSFFPPIRGMQSLDEMLRRVGLSDSAKSRHHLGYLPLSM